MDVLNIFSILKENAIKNPHRTAIVDGNITLSYSQVENMTNFLAKDIVSKIGSGKRVSTILKHGYKVILSAVAIIKSGNTYVPLNRNLYIEELAELIKSTNSQLIISDDTKIINLACYNNIPIIASSFFNEMLSCVELKNDYINSNFNDNQEAYIIHTSGSTGKPKAVRVSIGNFNYIIKNLQKYFPVDQNSRYLFTTPCTFDVSISEIFVWLSGGGSVVCLDLNDVHTYKNFVELVSRYRITHTAFSPSAFSLLIKSIGDRGLKKIDQHIKYVLLAGERFLVEIHEKWLKLNLNFCLVNAYGPTETTVYATFFILPKEKLEYIPIGKGFDDVNIKIKKSKSMSANKGELLIGGKGVSLGYTDIKLTNEKFVTIDGVRYYKTGDIVAFDNNYDLIYFGRFDDQIQRNGIRVELSEIENKIEKLSLVEQVSVIYHDSKVICFLSLNRNAENFKIEIERTLQKYLIPNEYFLINDFPLTINNKVDKKELIKIHEKNVYNIIEKSQTTVYKNSEEKEIIKIFGNATKTSSDKLNRYSDFFEIGGDSLGAFEVIFELEKTFLVKLDVNILYIERTPKDLWNYIQKLSIFNNKEHGMKDINVSMIASQIKNSADSYLNNSVMNHILYSFDTIHSQRVYYYTKYKESLTFALKIEDYSFTEIINVVKKVIDSNEILRATLSNSNEKLKFDVWECIPTIPVVEFPYDISLETLEKIANKAMNNIIFDSRYNNKLMNCFIVFKLKQYQILLVSLDHTIADQSSTFIIKKQIGSLLKNSSPINTNKYSDFCEIVKKFNSPRNLEKISFHNSLLNFQNISDMQLKRLEKKITSFEYEYIKRNTSRELIIYSSFIVGNKLINKLDVDQILVKSVVDGRNTKMHNFKNTIGDFHGSLYLPVLKNENFNNFHSRSSKIYDELVINGVYRPGILFNKNFPYLSQEEILMKNKWKNKSIISLNFMGEITLEEKKDYYDRIGEFNKNLELMSKSIYTLCFLSGEKLHFLSNYNFR